MVQLLLVPVALAADAFAVSIAVGTLCGAARSRWPMLSAASLFGLFQFMMPLLGYSGTSWMFTKGGTIGRIVATVCLAAIGVKMIIDRAKKEHGAVAPIQQLALAVATSIDALLVGVGYAGLEIGIGETLFRCIVIGIITFLISIGGCAAGYMYGEKNTRHAMTAGGCILILIAVKSLF
ncbi:MAG: manganese efflux pump MntP family protein [Victivallaceae bacterium]|nr:manganese efflux pump MntP family protein [Victivallaceae bacterium]